MTTTTDRRHRSQRGGFALLALLVMFVSGWATPARAADSADRPPLATPAAQQAVAERAVARAAATSRRARRRALGRLGDRRCSASGLRAVRGTTRVERQVRCLLNRARRKAGIPALRYDRCLDRAAELHARDMVVRRYFAHTSAGGRTLTERATAAGYVPRAGGWRLGENLAWGHGRRATASAAMHGWMRSPPHRRNVLTGGFRDVGVAAVHGSPFTGRPRDRLVRRGPATFVVAFGARERRACGR